MGVEIDNVCSVITLRAWGRGVSRQDDMRAGRLEPTPLIVQAGINAGSADNDVGRFERNVVHALEKIFKHAGEFAPAPAEESGGVSVAVDRVAVGKLVLVGNDSGAAPADEIPLDRVPIGSGASGAPAGVVREVGRNVGSLRGCGRLDGTF